MPKKEELVNELNNMIDAWESLKGGQHHSVEKTQQWLLQYMAPAVRRARRLLGREAPKA